MEQIALLFTDIEGSTRLLERSPSGYAANLRQHHEILRNEAERFGGREILDAGDGLGFAFVQSEAAARAAREMQMAITAAEWSNPDLPFSVRVAVHWTAAEFRDGQYRGPGIHFIARLLSSAHGGQILASQASVEQFSDEPPIRRVALGTYRLRGFQTAEKIFQLEVDDAPASFPPLKADQARQPNLPTPPGKFIGRKKELAEITRLLNDPSNRVVTLTGTGGSGKSRLALAAAEELLAPFDHGVYFVSLVELTDSAAIPSAILAALGAKPGNQMASIPQIQEVLKGARTLFVLDNFEQFAAEGAAVMSQLLEGVDNTVYLITSRARVGISAECEMALSVFPVPDAHEHRAGVLSTFDCIQFFIECAHKVSPSRLFGAEDLIQIAEICRLVDGLPLAIELVSSRVNALTTTELNEQLRQGFSAADSETHSRLENAFEWSLRLLPPEIARMLISLSAFRGGWTIQSASAVAGTSEALTQGYLHYLLTCSLIQAQEQAQQMRFNLLIPFREFAEARLGPKRAATYRRHSQFFRDLVKRADQMQYTPEGSRFQQIVDLESENILVGMIRERKVQRRLDDAIEFQSFARNGIFNRPLRQLLHKALARNCRIPPLTRALVCHAVATLDSAIGQSESANFYLRKAAKGLSDCGRTDAAMKVRYNLATTEARMGNRTETLLILQECLLHFRGVSDKGACAVVLDSIGRHFYEEGEFKQSLGYFEQSISLSRETNDQHNLASGLCGLGEVLNEINESETATSVLIESVEVKLLSGKHSAICYSFYALAKTALLRGNAVLAAQLFGVAEGQMRKYQIIPTLFYRSYLELIQGEIQAALGAATFEIMKIRGCDIPPSEWMNFLRIHFPARSDASISNSLVI